MCDQLPLPSIPDVTLQREIARGGMGVVYRGRQDFLDRDVAVKLLSPHLQGEPFAARFRREAKILAGIKHPHIVACHMAGTTSQGQSYLVMEFVDGPSLAHWIAEHGPVALPSALRLVRQLASALGHACDLGVIHRDVKPENILLEAATSPDAAFPFVPKLVDLGLGRMTSASKDPALTAPGAVMGTPATMAPEQFDDPDAVDHRTDIYGLGCVLYQMLTGVVAFASTKLTDLVVEKRLPNGPDPCQQRDGIPAAVGQLVASMLANDRTDRPGSYPDLVARLDELAALPAALDQGRMPAARAAAAPSERVHANLLQTAEFEFLAAGGDRGGGEPAAFPEPSALPSRTAVGANATATRASLPRRGRRRLVAIAVIATIGVLATSVGLRRHPWLGTAPALDLPQDAASAPTPAAQVPDGIAIQGLDGEVRPEVPIELRADAGDRAGDALHYRWTVRPEGAASLAAPTSAATALRLEGLPGDEFSIGLEVQRNGGEPVRVVRNVTLDYQPLDLFADFLGKGTSWQSRGRPRGEWRRNAADGAVSCVADDFPCFGSRSIDGTVWRVVGQLRPERRDARSFAQTAVCVRIGTFGQLALVCERQGLAGEQWSLSLQEVDREVGRAAFAFRPLARQPKLVGVVDTAGTLDGATYTITRRDNELTFVFGFPGIGEMAEHRERLRTNVDSMMLSLFAKGGRAVYPSLRLW